MNIITVDFESFYDDEYSLSKLATEDYVWDERFEAIGVSLKLNGGPSSWFSGTLEETKAWIHRYVEAARSISTVAELTTPACSSCGSDFALLAHNTVFDGSVWLSMGLPTPTRWLDTKSMAKAILGQKLPKASLGACLVARGLPYVKGDDVVRTKGKRRADFTPEELERFGEYCRNDNDACFALFVDLMRDFPVSELTTVDLTMRMYFEPAIELDIPLLVDIMTESMAKQARLTERVKEIASRDELSSNQKFAEVLTRLGITVPMKESPTNPGTRIPALAKNDAGMKDLVEEYADDELITALFDARRGVKSTQEYSRAVRLRDIGVRFGRLRVPLNYHSAHTSRYGGTESLNLQNLPRTRNSKLRGALRAPAGHQILAADLSQIEARLAAWLAGQWDLVNAFARGEDVYCILGTDLYGRSITRADKKERDIAKEVVLSCQFGVSPKTLRRRLRGQYDIIISEEESERFVRTYRAKFNGIPRYWKWLDEVLGCIATGTPIDIGPCRVEKKGEVLLPDGLKLYYPRLEWHADPETGESGWRYWAKGRYWKRIYGAAFLENLCQTLAQRLLVWLTHRIQEMTGLKLKLQVHDELVFVVKTEHAEIYQQALEKIMVIGPDWTRGLPIAVEVGFAQNYAEVK